MKYPRAISLALIGLSLGVFAEFWSDHGRRNFEAATWILNIGAVILVSAGAGLCFDLDATFTRNLKN